ncbi:MAG: L-lactate dehydrogenase, partial [Pseudomonadota bacterium]
MTTSIITLQDHEHAAQAALGEAAWAYFSGGAGDEITLRRNVDAWQRLNLSPRVLQDLGGLGIEISALKQFALPSIARLLAQMRPVCQDHQWACGLGVKRQVVGEGACG